jgi:D-alanyl-D-alanine carboxypeptidase
VPRRPRRPERRARRGRLVALLLLVVLGAAAAAAAAGSRDPGPRALAPPAPPATDAALPPVPRQDVLPPIARPRPAGPRPSGPRFALPRARFDVRLGGRGPRAGALVDLDSGRVLWARGWRTPRTIASLTKTMTALVAVDALTPRERVRVSRRAAGVRGSQAGLAAGARVRADALLTALMLPSGNDAAIALAEGVSGTERRFVRRMNARARAYGLRCTRFVSASGLGRGNRACPADLAELTRRALAEPRLARIVRRPSARVRAGARTLRVASTNPLVRARLPGVLGLKTGWTPSAGRCLIAVVRRDGRRYAAVLLDDADPAGTARRLVAAATR